MSLQDDLNNLTEDPSVVPLPVKIGVILFIMGLILFLGYKLFIVDDIAQQKAVQFKEPQLLQDLSTKQKRAVLLPIYKAQLAEMELSFKSMKNQLPSKTEIPDLILDISGTALTNGLTTEIFEPKPEIKQAFYAEKPIKIRVIGTYNQLGSFASAISDLPRIVTLHNIELSPEDIDDTELDSNAPTKLVMNAEIKTYRYLEEEAE
ncbi:MAG: type 4a pilus biogenesis protein PilO [bacterium]